MSKYFGTDGFRGEANKALNVEHAYKIGRFLGAYYGREHKCSVVIGKDTRRSGYMFECALTAGLTASGADAYLMHVTTTPSVSYITRTDDFDCGIMISASHNPYFDNGIKLLNGDGEKMEQYVIDEIERYLDGKGAEIPLPPEVISEKPLTMRRDATAISVILSALQPTLIRVCASALTAQTGARG